MKSKNIYMILKHKYSTIDILVEGLKILAGGVKIGSIFNSNTLLMNNDIVYLFKLELSLMKLCIYTLIMKRFIFELCSDQWGER